MAVRCQQGDRFPRRLLGRRLLVPSAGWWVRVAFAIQIPVATAIRDRIFRNKESLGKVLHSIITAFLSDLMLGHFEHIITLPKT